MSAGRPNRVWTFFAGILVAGAALRFAALESRPLHGDEAVEAYLSLVVRNTGSLLRSIGTVVQPEVLHWTTATGSCVPSGVTRIAVAAAMLPGGTKKIPGATAAICTVPNAVVPLAL